MAKNRNKLHKGQKKGLASNRHGSFTSRKSQKQIGNDRSQTNVTTRMINRGVMNEG